MNRIESETCQICGVICRISIMIKVPYNPKQQWKKRLRRTFALNTQSFEPIFVCRVHINNAKRYDSKKVNDILDLFQNGIEEVHGVQETVEDNNRIGRNHTKNNNSSRNRLPERMNSKLVAVNEKEVEQIEEMISNEELVGMIFERSETTEQNREVTNEENQKMEEDNQDCIELMPPTAEVVFPRKMSNETNQYLKPVVVQMEMKEHENNHGELVPDSIQAEKINDSNSPDASLTSEKNGPNCSEPEPIKIEVLDFEVVEQGATDGTLVHNKELIQCRVCDNSFDKIQMAETPTDHEEMMKWFKTLGPVFVENIIKNSPPHFICISDLRKMVTQFCQK